MKERVLHEQDTGFVEEKRAVLKENARLLEENGRLMEEIKLLRRHRDVDGTTKNFVDKAIQTIPCPISSLPPEILSEVFILRCSAERSYISYYLDYRSPPLDLAHVCRQWRALALDIPKLWGTFTVDIGIFGCSRDLLLFYLKHSRDSPLFIQCEEYGTVDPHVLPVLVTHSNRWRSVSLSFHAVKQWRKYTDRLSCNLSFPNLKTVALHQTNYYPGIDIDIRHVLRTLFQDVPSLQELLTSEDTTYPPFDFPRHYQITSFEFIAPFTCMASFQGVDSFCKLEELTIPEWYITHSYKISISVGRPIRLTALKTLTIRFPEENDGHLSLYPLFRVFQLPSLTELTVTSPRYTDCFIPPRPWDSDAFNAMVARSKCELEWLTLSNLLISPFDIQATLVGLPTLKGLIYHECGDTTTTKFLLDLLRPTPEALLPGLRELGIAMERADEEAVMVKLVIEMVESRWMEGLPALTLTIRVRQPLQAVNREALRGVNAEAIEKLFFISC